MRQLSRSWVPNLANYNLAKLQLKAADILNNIYGVRRQNYGELKTPEMILQSTFSRFCLEAEAMSDWTLTAKTPQRVTSMTKNIPHIIALSLHYPWIPITRFWSSAQSGLFSHILSHISVFHTGGGGALGYPPPPKPPISPPKLTSLHTPINRPCAIYSAHDKQLYLFTCQQNETMAFSTISGRDLGKVLVPSTHT